MFRSGVCGVFSRFYFKGSPARGPNPLVLHRTDLGIDIMNVEVTLNPEDGV